MKVRIAEIRIGRIALALAFLAVGLVGLSSRAGAQILFQDDFETGDLSKWTRDIGLKVQQQVVFSGSWAARSTGGSDKAFAWKRISPTKTNLRYASRFKILSHADGANLLRFRTDGGSSILSLGVNKSARLYVHNHVARRRTTSQIDASDGAWHLVDFHAVIGNPGSFDVSLDGVPVTSLSKSESLGTMAIGRINLGDPRKGKSFDVAFDDVGLDAAVASAPRIAAAGDIACDPASSFFKGGSGTSTKCRQMATSNLLVGAGLEAVLALGDTQYECGGYQAYVESYDPSWGRVKSITHPIPGNHEYSNPPGATDCDPTRTADGYFDYFGAAAGAREKGYYSFDVGTWHLVALNSVCVRVGGCQAGAPQETWLRADLAANDADCTLAFVHDPRWSSGPHGDQTAVADFWKALHDDGVEIALSGNDHIYERFKPQTPAGTADPSGVRQFVVGTGGKVLYDGVPGDPDSQVLIDNRFGVLFLTLHPTSYEWAFVSATGQTLDSGSTACH
jgi:hypothetical protein